MTDEAAVKRFAREIIDSAAAAGAAAEQLASCPKLLELARLMESEDTTRGERLRIYLIQYRSELIAELETLSIRLQWPSPEAAALPDDERDWHEDEDDDPLNGRFEETDRLELFAAANRARKYIDGTF